MPIPLPHLDDLDWKQLTEEARLLIPGSAPEWTDYNVSDPGITIVEVFAYFTEALQYRLNQINDAETQDYLKLIHGPAWRPGNDLRGSLQQAARHVHDIHRAVTAADYEALALAVNGSFRSPYGEKVSRLKALACRNLQDSEGTGPGADAPGHVSLVVLSNRRQRPSDSLLRAIRSALEPARLLTTRIHVVPPRFVTITVRVTLVPRSNVDPSALQLEAAGALERFFDPLEGGAQGTGWPFGRSVYVSEVYQLLGGLQGVDFIRRTRDAETGEELDELAAGEADTDRMRWNDAGELEAIELDPDELVAAWIDTREIGLATDQSIA